MLKAVLMSAVAAALCSPAAAVSKGAPSGQESARRAWPSHGPFVVEVVSGGTPLEKLFGRGRTYVEAREGAEYEVVVRNPLPVRVAVALSVDGLNTIDARRTSSWDASKWVVEPYGTLRVAGWQMSASRSRRFYFTSERDSYAAKLGRASDLGVITAVFYREAAPAYVPGPPRPYPLEDERSRVEGEGGERKAAPSASRRSEQQSGDAVAGGVIRRDDDYAATGIGRPVENHVYRVEMSLERRPAAEVTIRYEYRPALVRLGLLPRPRPYYDDDPLRRRERARGFTDTEFCPEP